MEYLTTNETAEKWGISGRMVAYYCKAGNIAGAVKKGKTWLIPANAEKPDDHRFRKNRIQIQDNPELQSTLQSINRPDSNNKSIYLAKDIYKNLGLTRETLRYYEEIGLITPKRNLSSQYREFTFEDVSRLMSIDFYKKRGFTPLEIRELMNADNYSNLELINSKIIDVEERIRTSQRMLMRLTATKEFCECAAESNKVFTVKDLPLYWVQETFDAVSSLKDYQERVLASLDLREEDILSNLVRVISFDPNGYKGAKMCLVSKKVKDKTVPERLWLESGRCLYTILDADSHDDSLMEKMFFESYRWAAVHREHFKGVVYIFIRFVELAVQAERNFYEVWIPLK